MLEEPAFAVYRVALVIAVMGLVIGAMYLGGGAGAIRRQVLKLAFLACGLLVIVFAVPPVVRAIGSFTFAIPLLLLNAIFLAAWVVQRRRESPAVAQRRREALRSPAVRALFVAFFAFVAIATVLLLIITAR